MLRDGVGTEVHTKRSPVDRADLTLVKINWPHQAHTPRFAEPKPER
jgi:hypothetical protein